MNLSIENTQWTVKTLIRTLDNIIKPKFQRKKRWIIIPCKKKCPSYYEYIKFLYSTKNSIDVISFGVMIENNCKKYYNIDGNNRINAIVKFMKSPLVVLEPDFNNEIKFLEKYIDNEILLSLSYDELCGFRRLEDLITIHKIIKKNNIEYNQEMLIHNKFVEIQNKLLVKEYMGCGSKFNDVVKLNVNIFSDGTFEDYNNIFKSINTHSNELSENELLASLLYSNNINLDIITKNIIDNNICNKILDKIKEFYKKRDENEVLNNNINIINNEINIFDYMVGLQNLLSCDYQIFSEYKSSNNNLGIIFKLYRIMYNTDIINNKCFNNENIIKFTNNIIKTSEILKNTFNKLFSDKLNDKIFGSSVNIVYYFKENGLAILCSTVLALLEKNYKDEYIINQLLKPIIYHIFLKYININDENREQILLLKEFNKLKYEAGGNFMNSICKKIYNKDPNYIFKELNKDKFSKLLNIFMLSNIRNKEYKQKKKRRKLNITHKIIFSIIFKNHVTIKWLDYIYSIEHLIPFSTKHKESELIDLDRFGNLYPIPLKYNTKRGNRHINNYIEICKEYYKNFISKLCSSDDYDTIIYYSKNTELKNINNYNELCNKNELYYTKCLIDFIFPE